MRAVEVCRLECGLAAQRSAERAGAQLGDGRDAVGKRDLAGHGSRRHRAGPQLIDRDVSRHGGGRRRALQVRGGPGHARQRPGRAEAPAQRGEIGLATDGQIERRRVERPAHGSGEGDATLLPGPGQLPDLDRGGRDAHLGGERADAVLAVTGLEGDLVGGDRHAGGLASRSRAAAETLRRDAQGRPVVRVEEPGATQLDGTQLDRQRPGLHDLGQDRQLAQRRTSVIADSQVEIVAG